MLPLKAEGNLSLQQAPSASGGLATTGTPAAELSISPKHLLQSSTSHREGDGAWGVRMAGAALPVPLPALDALGRTAAPQLSFILTELYQKAPFYEITPVPSW